MPGGVAGAARIAVLWGMPSRCKCIALLITAITAYPDKPWMIVSGINHSTVWAKTSPFLI